MIDIHTHILPSIDDGSSSVEETFDMLNEAYDAGFTDIITTSHYITEQFEVNKKERDFLIQALQKKVDVSSIDLTLHNGAESYIMPELASYYEDGIIPTLANSRYVLFEFPMNSKVIYGDAVISELRSKGYIPVIAHPERYSFVQKNIDIAFEWAENGAFLQSNYGSIIQKYGKEAKKTFLKLLKSDVITFLGTDCHARGSVYSQMDDILDELSKHIGNDKIDELTRINQLKVINDEIIV